MIPISPNYSIDFANYRISSHTLMRTQNFELELEGLRKAEQWLTAAPSVNIDLYTLNQCVLQVSSPQRRVVTLHAPYRFPDPDEIEAGIEIIQKFMRESRAHSIVKHTAYMQALLSLHPFADGNHRTCRLLLDFALCRLGYPPTKCVNTTDLVFANPVGEKIFSLTEAVQAVLHAMGETIRTAEPKIHS